MQNKAGRSCASASRMGTERGLGSSEAQTTGSIQSFDCLLVPANNKQTMRPVQCAHLRKRERFRRARSQQAEVRSNSLVGPKKKLSGEAAHRSANMRLSTSNECICCSVGTALVKPATACHASPSSCSSAKGTTWAGATIASEHRVHTRQLGRATLAAGENNLASRAKITYQRFYHTTFFGLPSTAQNNLPSGKIPRVTGNFQTLVV